MEDSGIEPLTSWMQIRRSPSWANPPVIKWWAEEDLNFRPHAYQARALTNWATGPMVILNLFWKGYEDGDLTNLRFSLIKVRFKYLLLLPNTENSLERRWSSRRFPYGYLVTTSPQSLTLPWPAPSKKVRIPSSGKTNSHGVTGGVYKARERIHRSMLIYDY